MALTKNKKAAIELSIGTVVIIVLAMSMLILGIVLIRSIFSGAKDSITQIDQGVKNEINKLFSENAEKRLVLLPDSKIIKIEQGATGNGFVVSIRNKDDLNAKQFTYKILLESKGSCPNDPISGASPIANIVSGQTYTTGFLPAGQVMENPRHVRIDISDTAPLCTFTLKVLVDEGTVANRGEYSFDTMDVQIIPK